MFHLLLYSAAISRCELISGKIRRIEVVLVVGVNIIAVSRRILIILVSNTDDSEVVREVGIVLIRTNHCCNINRLLVEIGQHLLKMRALQVNGVATHRAGFRGDLRIRVGVESADEPAVVVLNTP